MPIASDLFAIESELVEAEVYNRVSLQVRKAELIASLGHQWLQPLIVHCQLQLHRSVNQQPMR